MHLYETHLPVANTEVSKIFYEEVVGLEFAHRDPSQDIVFLWAGEGRRSMVGLWGPNTDLSGDRTKRHVAFALSLPESLLANDRLRALGMSCYDFFGKEAIEPSVIGWMPSAQIYFSDPDLHSLEFVALLDEAPEPDFIGSFSAWQARASGERPQPVKDRG